MVGFKKLLKYMKQVYSARIVIVVAHGLDSVVADAWRMKGFRELLRKKCFSAAWCADHDKHMWLAKAQ